MSLASSSVLTPDLCVPNSFISPDSSDKVVFGLLSKNLEKKGKFKDCLCFERCPEHAVQEFDFPAEHFTMENVTPLDVFVVV